MKNDFEKEENFLSGLLCKFSIIIIFFTFLTPFLLLMPLNSESAFAQGTLINNNANILIFLDTSGSMMWNQQVAYGTSGKYDIPESWLGSGSSPVWAPGSNSYFSKIYNAKLAIGGVIKQFTSMNFAFASFQQNSDFGETHRCIYSDDPTFTNPPSSPHYSFNLGGTGTPDISGAYGTSYYPFVKIGGTGKYCGHSTGEFTSNGVNHYFISYDYSGYWYYTIINNASKPVPVFVPYITNYLPPTGSSISSLSPWYLYFPVQSGGTLGTGTTSVNVSQPFQSGNVVGTDINRLLWSSEIYGSSSTNPAGTPIKGLKAGGGTPMSDSVADMYEFFKNAISAGTSSNSSSSSVTTCDRYFSIIVTDGEANMGCDWNAADIPASPINISNSNNCSINSIPNGISSSETPAEVYDMYNLSTPSSSSATSTNPVGGLITYMIGFGYSPTNPTSYLQEMANAGAGIDPTTYYNTVLNNGTFTPTLNFTVTEGSTPDTLIYAGVNPNNKGIIENGFIVGDTVSDNEETSVQCESGNNYSMTYKSPSDCATITGVYNNSGSTIITISNSLKTISNGITVSGTVYLANDYQILVGYLSNILKQIMSQTESFTAPVIHQVYGSNNDVYYANFTPSIPHRLWAEGNLFEFTLGSSGQLFGKNNTLAETCTDPNYNSPSTISGCPIGDLGIVTNDAIWSAGEQLTTNSSRNVLTSELNSSDGQTTPLSFNTSNASTLASLMGTTTTNAQDVIPFVLNPGANLGDPYTDWKLGAIYHSDPVFIGVPLIFPYLSVPSYQKFVNAESSRTPVLVVGADDGMLHGFNATTGAELFGYIPPDLLTELPQWYSNSLHTSTPSFVDSTPAVSDAYFNNLFVVNGVLSSNSENTANSSIPNDSWQTVLIGGERGGGVSYYAILLTNPASSDYPDPLWDFSDVYSSANIGGNMGYTWSKPEVSYVCLPYSTSINGLCDNNPSNNSEYAKIYAGFVGGGYSYPVTSTETSEGNAVYALYAEPNPVNTGTTTAPSYVDEQELWKFNASNDSNMTYSIPSSVSPILSPNGRIEAFYVGDTGGQMWAFDIPDDTMPYGSGGKSNWTGCRIFASNSHLEIFYPPATTNDTLNNFWIFFGTGDRAHLNNNTSTNVNELIGMDMGTNYSPGSCPTLLSGTKPPYSESNLETAPASETYCSKTNSTGTCAQTSLYQISSNYVGWIIKLPNANERVVSSPVVYDNIVYFTTYTPSAAGSCGYGTGRLYAVYYTNGGSAIESNGTIAEPITGSGSSLTSSTEPDINLGAGIPSAPVLSGNHLIVTLSGGGSSGPGSPTSPIVSKAAPGPVANITPTSSFQLP